MKYLVSVKCIESDHNIFSSYLVFVYVKITCELHTLERCCRPTYTRAILVTIDIYHHAKFYHRGSLLRI